MKTNRQKQAELTKKKIFNAAVYLMQKQGIEDTTIEQICNRAQVSIGSFYNYFKSKDDVIVVAFESADHFFEDIVVNEIKSLEAKDKIIAFFSHYAKYNNQQGFAFVKNLYSNSEQKLFVARNRYMHQLLRDILQEGQTDEKIKTSMKPEEIENFLFIVARGVVNDWCLYDGSYDLEKRMTDYITIVTDTFTK